MSIFSNREDIATLSSPFAGWGDKKYTMDSYGAHYKWTPQNKLGLGLMNDKDYESKSVSSILINIEIKKYMIYDRRVLSMRLKEITLEFKIEVDYTYNKYFTKEGTSSYHETIKLSKYGNIETMYKQAMGSLLNYVKNNWDEIKILLIHRPESDQKPILKNALTNYEYL